MCRTGDVWGDFELWGQGHSLNIQFARRPKSVLIRFVGFSGLPSHMPHRFWPFNRLATAFGPFRVRQMAPTCWDILDFLRSLPQSRNRRFLQALTYFLARLFFRFLPVPALYTMTTDWWLLEFAGLESEECSEFTVSMDSLLSPSEASRKISRTSKLGENIEYATSGRQTSASCSVKDFWVDFCLHEWTLWDFRNPQDVSILMWQHWCLKFAACSALLFRLPLCLRFGLLPICHRASQSSSQDSMVRQGALDFKILEGMNPQSSIASNGWTLER